MVAIFRRVASVRPLSDLVVSTDVRRWQGSNPRTMRVTFVVDAQRFCRRSCAGETARTL
jgi:hypothetical protein